MPKSMSGTQAGWTFNMTTSKRSRLYGMADFTEQQTLRNSRRIPVMAWECRGPGPSKSRIERNLDEKPHKLAPYDSNR